MKRGHILKHTPREITELLESDDELPDSYDETPRIPAYLDDNRFTKVRPVDIDEAYQRSEDITLQYSTSNKELIKVETDFKECLNSPQESHEESALKLDNDTKMISKGILTKRDIFLIKSIEEYTTEVTLLWFIDFLNYKGMKRHQRSCLVADVINDCSTVVKEPLADFQFRYYLKLVVN